MTANTLVMEVVEMPADVRKLIAATLVDAEAENGCLILEGDEADEAAFVEFVNMQLETARIQDGLVEPDLDQAHADLDYEGDRECDEMLFQRYLNESCRTCGGPCEPGVCEVLTAGEWCEVHNG
jgi:hypothetical protein